jgi:hypothetical protein
MQHMHRIPDAHGVDCTEGVAPVVLYQLINP